MLQGGITFEKKRFKGLKIEKILKKEE